jgi:amino acid transporter
MTNLEYSANVRTGRSSSTLGNGQPHLKRVLGRADLTFFLIAALADLNSVPVVAGIGPAVLVLWLAGFILFFTPQSVAVLELFSRFPQEGGIYRWNSRRNKVVVPARLEVIQE